SLPSCFSRLTQEAGRAAVKRIHDFSCLGPHAVKRAMTNKIVPFAAAILCFHISRAQVADRPVTRADILRGEYGPYRSNNDLLHYDLRVRVDPDKKSLSGAVVVRFKMLKDDSRIQLDLYPHLAVDKVLFEGSPLKFEREFTAVFVDFMKPLKAGK